MDDPRKCGTYLKRLQFFLNIVGNPEKKIPHYIHVTGTSGKGSVCSYLESILRASGKKTGLYISPHPTHLTERWEINGKHMSRKEFATIVTTLKPKMDEYLRKSPYDMLSFFDLTTAIALYYFAQKKVEWAVIEVGCGGRYDSTNVIPRKDIAVITNIGLDHTDILGNTKEKIAYEKAGIITRGCSVYTMETNKRVVKIIQRECARKKVLLKDTRYKFPASPAGGQDTKKTYCLTAIGQHQTKNAALAAEVAKSLGIAEKYILKGLQTATQPLRMEIVSRKPLIILDGAHNTDKIATTVASIKTLEHKNIKTNKKIALIISFSDNKDTGTMIKQLASIKPKSIACTRNTVNPFRKVADPKNIAQKFRKLLPHSRVETFIDPIDALVWSKKQIKTSGMILATGSIFMSGELRRLFASKYLTQPSISFML